MEHHLDAVDGPCHRLGVLDRRLDELDVETVDVLASPGGEVVDDPHVISALEQGPSDVRSDETGSAGDECLHDPLPFPEPHSIRTSEMRQKGYLGVLRSSSRWWSLPSPLGLASSQCCWKACS
jgi:hypothetical protein